jgi:tRNA pseudouridine55 synthase
MNPSVRSGVLPVDKPEGPSSHDIVAVARRSLGTRRIGHTGTLDPFASGLLLLFVGWATRLCEYLVGLPKTYLATARLGESTDTDDRTGEVLRASSRWREVTAADVESAFQGQVGTLLQRPPAFSAKKVGGERSYRRARRGESVTAEPVQVQVYGLDVVALDLPDVRFEVECSSGTYIRAIARDAGEALGTGAHLVDLRRTRIGPHAVGTAVPADRLGDPDAVDAARIPPLTALAHLPTVTVTEEDAAELANGAAVTAPDTAPSYGPVAIAFSGRLLAVGESVEGRLRPRKVFPRD